MTEVISDLEIAKNDFGLGRVYKPDVRDRNFPMAAALPRAASARTSRYWFANGWWGNQGNTSQCVAYSWTHWLEDGPFFHYAPHKPILNPLELYKSAQKIDYWDGEDYEGTSVRAGAQHLQSLGLVEKYTWAFDVKPVVQALLDVGPVVVGTMWYDSMYYPKNGILVPDFKTDKEAGGHAYLLDGVNTKSGMIRVKNSWGRGWGRNGFGYISIDNMDKLIRAQGEACLAIECRKK